MEKVLNNTVRMINALTEFVDADTNPYSGILNFPIVNGQVKNKMTIVNGLNLVAGGTSKGVTIDVGLVRISMEELAEKIAKGTFAFASATNNNTLKARVNWTQAKLSKKQKEEVDDVCQDIHDAAAANTVAIAPYGVTAGDILALQGAIDLYRPLTGKTRMTVVNINSAKEQIKDIVDGIIKFELKGQMDPMIGTLEISNKVYHDKYFNMRERIDLGSTTAKVRGVSRDEDTDAFLNGVLFKMFKAGSPDVYKSDLSEDKGNFGISDIDADDYDFEWSKTGYVTKREEGVHISAGKELQRKITLKALQNPA
jgi:hypothetical protein